MWAVVKLLSLSFVMLPEYQVATLSDASAIPASSKKLQEQQSKNDKQTKSSHHHYPLLQIHHPYYSRPWLVAPICPSDSWMKTP